MFIDDYRNVIITAKDKHILPKEYVISGISSTPVININGRQINHFSSANYLGLANDPRIKESVIDAMNIYGLHTTGARFTSGTVDMHLRLEKIVSEFKKCEDTITFATGTMANMGVIPALVNLPPINISSLISKVLKINDPVIFSDELNHATIIDGCRLAKCKVVVYRHNDTEDLKSKIKNDKHKHKLIITDGVFSMDGDIAPVPAIYNIARENDALLMVDDAHGTGVLGDNGRGTCEHFGLVDGVDINMGTFSKAFGVYGGFVSAKKDIVDYLRISARSYIFSGSTLPSLAAGVIKSIEIVKSEPERRVKLIKNANYFRDGLKKLGFNTLNSETPIIPILIGDEKITSLVSDELLEQGFLAPAIRWPAVAKGKARIRFSIITSHSSKQIDDLIEVLIQIKNKYNIE